MNNEICVAISANDDQTVWDIKVDTDGNMPITPQEIMDGIAEYFLMMGYAYHQKLVPDDYPN